MKEPISSSDMPRPNQKKRSVTVGMESRKASRTRRRLKAGVVKRLSLATIFALFLLLCSSMVSLLPESVQNGSFIHFLKIHEANAATCTVTTTDDTGAGSLRGCIAASNGTPNTTIHFNITTAANENDGLGNSWWRITVVSPLPSITANNTVIDGRTQPGNTNSKGTEIAIYGGSAPNGTYGLPITDAGGVTIGSLVINGFRSDFSSGGTGVLIMGAGAATNKVQGNYIGTDATGTSAVGNYDGVIISNAGAGNTIGGTAAGAGNLISGNGHEGLWLSNTPGTLIQGNYIGATAGGKGTIPNGIDGIRLQNAPGTTIGGTEAGARNVIPGNRYMASCRNAPSLMLNSSINEEPVELLGSVAAFTLLVNATMQDLPSGDIRIQGNAIDEIIEVKGGKLDRPLEFQVEVNSPEMVTSWALSITDLNGNTLRTIQGTGSPSPTLLWDGRTEQNTALKGGEVYQYRLEVHYRDGSHVTSPIRLFGLARTSAVSIVLGRGAFLPNTAELSGKSKQILNEAAAILRKYPKEHIVIEGHPDSIGSESLSRELAQKRSESTASYFINEEKIPAERIIVRWFNMASSIAVTNTAKMEQSDGRVEI
ncbi:MAG: OmpA family protein, partial [Thermodesulfovibrionales bacterium]